MVGRDVELASLDPYTTTVKHVWSTSAQMNNSLLQFDPTLVESKLVGDLAESWETPAPDTWIFKLRPNVKFHDGTTFDAESVVFNFQRARDDKNQYHQPIMTAGTSLTFAGVESVTATDARTVRFNLNQPSVLFGTNAPRNGNRILNYMSPAAVMKFGDKVGQNPSGTGPFQFSDWTRDDHLTLSRFDGYFGTPSFLDKVIYRPIPEATSRRAAMESGEIDMLISPPPEDLPQYDKSDKVYLLRPDKETLVTYWHLNCADGPTADKRVRQAFNYAIDWKSIAKDLLGGYASWSTQYFQPGNLAFDPNLKPRYPYDPAEAKKLLAAAGYTGRLNAGKLLFFATPPFGYPFAAAAQAQQAMLAQVGIDVQLEPRPLAEAVSESAKGLGGSGRVGYTSGTAGDSPTQMRDLLHSTQGGTPPKGTNRGQFSNAAVDAAFDKAGKATTLQELIQLYREAQTLWLEEAPLLIGCNLSNPVVVSRRVGGLPVYRGYLAEYPMLDTAWKA